MIGPCAPLDSARATLATAPQPLGTTPLRPASLPPCAAAQQRASGGSSGWDRGREGGRTPLTGGLRWRSSPLDSAGLSMLCLASLILPDVGTLLARRR